MNDNDKRKFKTIPIGYTETINWEQEQCEEHFRNIQEGMSLSKGEILNSDSQNIFCEKIRNVCVLNENFIESKKSDGGMEIDRNRYKHYETIGCLFDMCLTGDFPLKAAQKSIKNKEHYDSININEVELRKLNQVEIEVTLLLNTYKWFIEKIPVLRRGACSAENWLSATDEAHSLRSIYFIYKQKIHENNLNLNMHSIMLKKFTNMIVKTHKTGTPERDHLLNNIKIWAQNDSQKIYEKYLEFYNE